VALKSAMMSQAALDFSPRKDDQWTYWETRKDVRISYRSEPNSSFLCFKLDATLEAPADKLSYYVGHSSLVGEIDKTTVTTSLVEKFQDESWLSYTVADPGPGFSFSEYPPH